MVSRRGFLRYSGVLLAPACLAAKSHAAEKAFLPLGTAPLGGLLLVGGPSRDHRGEPGTYEELIRRSYKGVNSTVSFVTSASSIFRRTRMEEHLASFRSVGVDPRNVHVISLMKKDDPAEVLRDTPLAVRPDDPHAFAEMIRVLQADDVVFLDGGDQKRLVHILKSSRIDEKAPSVWDVIAARYVKDRQFLLGGTSAGSAAMPRRMIHADTVSMPEKDQFWGFNLPGLERIAIDTHYDQRKRAWRFPAFMRKTGDLIGLGLPENGGIHVRDGVAEVFSVGETERRVAVQIGHPDGDSERQFRPGQRFALGENLMLAQQSRRRSLDASRDVSQPAFSP